MATSYVSSRSVPPRAEPEPKSSLRIEVILLSNDGNRFLVRADGARLRCVRVQLATNQVDSGTLKDLIEQPLITQAGVEASFLGLLSFETAREGVRIAVAAAVLTAQVSLPGDPSCACSRLPTSRAGAAMSITAHCSASPSDGVEPRRSRRG